MAALFFGNPAVRTRVLTRGFASQPHDWFAFVGRVEASPVQEPGHACILLKTGRFPGIGPIVLSVFWPVTTKLRGQNAPARPS
jgi:hypothetical protein